MPATSTIAPAPNPAPQHLEALKRANHVRLARAALKRDVASGRRSAAEVIVESPWESQSMPISELLSAQRRWGRTRSRKFLGPLNLSENKRIGTLTERQRLLLAAALRVKSGRPPNSHQAAALGSGGEAEATYAARPLVAVT